MGDTIDRAEGRWRDILVLNGVDAKFLTGKAGPCPMCGGTDRFTFDDKDGAGTYICRGCGAGYGTQLLMKFKGWTFKQAADAIDAVVGKAEKREGKQRRALPQEQVIERVRQRWSEGCSIILEKDRFVLRYLEGRGIVLQDPVHDLRQSTRGNMLALMRDPRGMPCQVHCTFLKDGRKADAERPRMFMKLPIPDGAAVRLMKPQWQMLGIAEGVETALSAAKIFAIPTWAALNTSMLRKWRPPEDVRNVVVFADNDANYAGQAAAYHLAHRLRTDERLKLDRVEVRVPAELGDDWNDALRRALGRGAALMPSTGLVAESAARC
jgi:putative DNA primase/helicase